MTSEGNGTARAISEGQRARTCALHAFAGHAVVQVRGVLAERVVISTALDPFMSLRALAAYSGLSVRKLREYLADPAHPLPCYRVGGKIVVRRSEFDAWIGAYRQLGNVDVEKIVSETLQGLQTS